MSVYQPVPKEAVLAAKDWRAKEFGIYGTRIIDFSVSDTRPAVGRDVTIRGTLQTHTPLLCWWEGLGGETVKILADDRELGSVLSGGDGVFYFVWRPTTVGEFLVRARYPGTWRFDPCESIPIRVKVLSEDEKAAEERMFWLMVGGVGIGAVAVVGGVIYYAEESRRREMMIMMAKR